MPQLDRFTRLELLDPDELARWLSLSPVLERLAFDPAKPEVRAARLMGSLAPRAAKTVEDLASIVDSGTGGMAVIRGLDTTAYKLLLQAVWSGGTLTRDAVLGSTGWPKDPRSAARMEVEIDAAAERLRFLLLAEAPEFPLPSESTRPVPASPVAHRSKIAVGTDKPSEPTWLRIVDDTRALLTLPGISLRDGLSILPSDDLAAMAQRQGMGWDPSRRTDVEKALRATLSDGAQVTSLVEPLSAESLAMLRKLISTLGREPFYKLGIRGHVSMDRRSRISDRRAGYPAPASEEPVEPLRALHDAGLIGVDARNQDVWVWREVAQILRPDVIASWTTPAAPVPTPIIDHRFHTGRPLANLERLFELWMASPPAALADGGLGVASVRSAAKKIGIPPGHLGLLVHLAIGLGLLRSRVIGTEGRGRSLRYVHAWETTESAAEWTGRPPAERWAILVNHWLTDDTLEDSPGLPERWQPRMNGGSTLARHLILRLLEDLDHGHGISEPDVSSQATQRWHNLLWPSLVSTVVEATRALGLTPNEGAVGLTESARAWLDGRTDDWNSLNQSVEVGNDSSPATIVVQGDCTVIATPDTELEARLFLDRIALLETDGVARVYRLTEPSLSAAMAAGLSATKIIEGLDHRSRTPIPQNVRYLITDVERKRNLIVLAPAVTVIASSDPALIASAVRVKAANLRELGPYTAISSLPAEKVRSALAAKGVFVTVESGVAEPAPAAVANRSAKELPVFGKSAFVGRSRIRSEAVSLLAES